MSENSSKWVSFIESDRDFDFQQEQPASLIHGDTTPGNPQLSILIPTFRRPELLRAAISSALNQNSYFPYEVIVVDNEQDPIVSREVDTIVGGFNSQILRLHRNSKNLGMFGNWNRCIELARGEWFTILNDDDYFLPGFLEEFFRTREELKNPNLIQLGYFKHDMREHERLPERPPTSRKLRLVFPQDLLYGNKRAGSLGVFFKTDYAKEIGGYDPSFYPTSDLCFYLKYLVKFGEAFDNSKQLCVYRVLDNESQKPEVLTGFVCNEYRLRKYLCDVSRFSILAKFYSDLVVMAHIYNLERAWGVKLDRVGVQQAAGVSKFAMKLPSLASRLGGRLIRMIFPVSVFRPADSSQVKGSC